MAEDDLQHHYVELGDVRLHYAEAAPKGRPDAPLVVLLHGFPEYWHSWHHQLRALQAAGFRAVAPDLRGYNESSKPDKVSDYHTDVLAQDVANLIEHLGEDDAVVVGHDWGGMVAWWTANNHPERVRKLAILNAPHPGHTFKMMRSPAQLRRSWYMFFFQIPGLPEWFVARNQYAAMRKVFEEDPVRKGAFTEEDIRGYIEVAQKPGVATATINYYRAVMRQNPFAATRKLVPLQMPVRVIWGAQDRYLGIGLAHPPAKLVPLADVQILDGASHWVQVDAHERVSELLIEFVRA